MCCCRLAAYKKAELKQKGFRIQLQQEPFALSVVTPLMQRTLQSATGRTASFFIDTSSSCDQLNTALTLVLLDTKAGAVPVGVCLHDSQSEASYKTVFSQLNDIWSSIGTVLIENFMTDDSTAIKNALAVVWPDVRQLLCLFHVPQAVWRWLWDSRHRIDKADRKVLMHEFQAIMRETSAGDADRKLHELLDTCDYEQFTSHVEKLWERKEEWCMAYRLDIINRGNNTNNYAEATFRVLKDIILTRLKAYNPLALLDFVVVVLEKYYCGRLLKASFGRLEKPYLVYQKVRDRATELVESCPDAVLAVGSSLYEVKSSKLDGVVYEVNSDAGVCSCFSGQQGGFCKHQAAVHVCFGTSFPNCPLLSPDDKKSLYFIATGNQSQMMPSFFAPIDAVHSVELSSAAATASASSSASAAATSHADVVSAAATDDTSSDNISTFHSADFTSEMSRLSQMLQSNSTDEALMRAASKFTTRISRISTPMQLYQFLTSSDTQNTRRARKIRVQPTSIARRADGATHGSARHRAGRPLTCLKRSATKRPRLLSANVAADRPNAKSHGDAH